MADTSRAPQHPGVPLPEDARASSDRMLSLIERLRMLETEKRGHPLGSTEFVALATEAEELSRLVFRWSQMQEALAEQSRSGDVPAVPIRDVPPRPIHQLLADWREAELRLVGAPLGSPEAQSATDRIEELREEYQRLTDEQRRSVQDG